MRREERRVEKSEKRGAEGGEDEKRGRERVRGWRKVRRGAEGGEK